MNYQISHDLSLIRKLFDLSQEELANILDVNRLLIARTEVGASYPRIEFMDRFYNFCYEKGLKLNIQKEILYKDNIDENHILLTHASKHGIDGDLSLNKGRIETNFGKGFYCGESYEKALAYILRYPESSVYFIDFDPTNLKSIKFKVDTDWMIAVAYFRGKLDQYRNTKIVKKILTKLKDVDYIIAPIADNRMFEIIDSFINGEITNEQCKHSLRATNLGMQYVFISDKSLKNLNIIERCFVSSIEKEDYKKEQAKLLKIGQDKSKVARIEYKNKGKYIGELS